MSKKIKILLDVVLLLVLLMLDQFTKYLAIVKLKGQQAIPIIKDVLELDYLENRGSAFGILQNQKLFILFVGVVFLSALVFLILRLPNERKYNILHVCLTCIIAGGLGNMIDRIRFDYVVDFISFVLIHFPIFNVADMYIVVATILMFIILIFVYKDQDLEFLSLKSSKRAAMEEKKDMEE